jgi:hypothetical protein
MSISYISQNDLILENLLSFYRKNDNLRAMVNIINGNSVISLRLVDWFVTNYSKKNFTVYTIEKEDGETRRFKVYTDYKLQLKAYSKRRFDPFCRWDRITIPYNTADGQHIQTTIGQLNFFKWAFENKIIDYVREHYKEIEDDMNDRNSNSRTKEHVFTQKIRKISEKGTDTPTNDETNAHNNSIINLLDIYSNDDILSNKSTTRTRRKKREELSISASKSIKRENVEIVVKFD